ncbi:MAG: T9SS type A sorting domain-containing protein, partial [Ignavibacteriae bacterium]|nr:T9SS type A sorting domain-containing protein [Ignavibacteriota bacterium]
DNLPPFGVVSLAAHSQGESSVLLSWNTNRADPDVEYYEVHRSATSNFIPEAGTKIGQTTDTIFTDNSYTSTSSFYRLVTTDIHGSRSIPSPQASLLITDVNEENAELPLNYELGQNYPNPFNPSTVIRYQLPVASWVMVKVYNVLGEEVVTLVDGIQEAGFKSVEFSAKGGLPSGVYVYRLTAGDPSTGAVQTFSDVKRLLLLK